jgi:subtilisin family serine protease
VAACDVDGNGAAFSSNGKGDVALSAPGIGIRSSFPGGGYKLWTGTSMSAPFVTGTVALLAEKHPNWNKDLMEARLQGTMTALKSVPPGTTDSFLAFGNGMLNIGRALAPDFTPPTPTANQDPPIAIRPR